MKKLKMFVLTSFLIFVQIVHAKPIKMPQECGSPMSLSDFKDYVHSVKDKFFPDLNGVQIDVKMIKSSETFYSARPKILSGLTEKNPLERVYIISVNQKALNCPPNEIAHEAVIVHELEHINDYVHMSRHQLAKFGINYVRMSAFIITDDLAKYERATDTKVLMKGLGMGLIEFRKWVYAWLTPEGLITKERVYLKPDEIELWMCTSH